MTKNFKRSEFACKCGCGLDAIDPKLVDKLQRIRDIVGEPMRITSGCRCKTHNARVGGKPDSAHQPSPINGQCKAADIACRSGQQMFKMIQACYQAEIRRIGINFNQNFIHVDIDETKPQDVIFKY